MCDVCDHIEQGNWYEAVRALADKLAEDPDHHLLDKHLIGQNCLLLQRFVDRGYAHGQRNDHLDHVQEVYSLFRARRVREGLSHLYQRRDGNVLRRMNSFLDGVLYSQLAAAEFQCDSQFSNHKFTNAVIGAVMSLSAAFEGHNATVEKGFSFAASRAHGNDATVFQYLMNRAVSALAEPKVVGLLTTYRLIEHLMMPEESADQRETVRTPILTVLHRPEEDLGIVYHLVVRRCKEGIQHWYPDPVSMAFMQLGRETIESFESAWQLTRKRPSSYCSARIEFEAANPPSTPLDGPSLGGAVYCCFQAIHDKADDARERTITSLDGTIAVTAALNPDIPQELASVGGIENKVEAAFEHKTIRKIAVPLSNQVVAETHLNSLRDQGVAGELTVVPFNHVDELYSCVKVTDQSNRRPAPPQPASSMDSHRPVHDAGGPADADTSGSIWRETESETECIAQIVQPVHNGDVSVEVLRQRIHEFQEAGLSSRFLVPSDIEQNGAQLSVVYDRPVDETPDDWRSLRELIAAESHLGGADESSAGPPPGLSPLEILWVGMHVASGLAELHQKNLVHGALRPENVLIRQYDGRRLVVLKFDWSATPATPGYLTEEVTPDGPVKRTRTLDCYNLGALLFECVVHQPFNPAEAEEGQLYEYVHESLEGRDMPDTLVDIISECLSPPMRVQFRPSAESLEKRLWVAGMFDRNALAGWAEEFDLNIQAGCRLFIVQTDDIPELERSLQLLKSRPRARRLYDDGPAQDQIQYHLLTAEEEVGLGGARTKDWVNEEQVYSEWLQHAQANNLAEPPWPDSRDVAAFNSSLIFTELDDYQSSLGDSGRIPILLIKGVRWWELGTSSNRYLRDVQQRRGAAPVVIVADRKVAISAEIAPFFHWMQQPLPTIARVFSQIYTRGRKLSADFTEMQAVELATHVVPCSLSELNHLMRVCELKYGCLNSKLIDLKNEERGNRISRLGTAHYFAPSQLPGRASYGLPDEPIASHPLLPTMEQVEQWAEHLKHQVEHNAPDLSRRFVMICGESGAGKTRLAQVLAGSVGLPLIRINSAACLRGGVGESEFTLRNTLNEITSLHSGVVLLDDADRMFQSETGEGAVEATLGRMSGLLLNWLDSPRAKNFIVVVTCRSFSGMPAQWRRRANWHIELPRPRGFTLVGYRQAIFSACLRARGLNELADNDGLCYELASRTDSDGSPRLLSPVARLAVKSRLRDHLTSLKTATEIEDWIQETLLLHAADGDPRKATFWQAAVSPGA